MSTLYDATMLDFENTMDADMLTLTASDIDWSQLENMVEDDDVQRSLLQEVDMSHDDVQEFEMTDPDFGGDVHQDTSDGPREAEPQDQEIPDASRAPSPGPLDAISSHIHSFVESAESIQRLNQSLREASPHAEPLAQSTQVILDTSCPRDTEAVDSSTSNVTDLSTEETIPRDVIDASAADGQDTSTISGESAQHQEQQQQQQEALETLEHPDASGNPALNQLEQYGETTDEDHANRQGQNVDVPAENEVAETDDDGLLMDPPPPVLLFYPFDNSCYAFFSMPDTAHVSDDSALKTSSALTDDQVERRSNEKNERFEDHLAHSAPNHTSSNSPILLFRERFALYYEPLSLVFEALRTDSDVNVEGRFDDNVELVISAPELDLNLPEDNIHSRDVSLHDLGLLHNGCELSGPLSLRLDTVSPRFGTRYKAIRDEILRVVSQQEEEERESQLGHPGVGAPFHDSSETPTPGEMPPNERNLEHENPEAIADSGENNIESPEPQQELEESRDVIHEHDTSDPLSQEDTQNEDILDNVSSREYLAYHDGDDTSRGAEVQAAVEYYAQEEHGENIKGDYEGDYEDENPLYDEGELENRQDEIQSFQEEEYVGDPDAEDAIASLDIAEAAPEFPYETVEILDESRTPVHEDSKRDRNIPMGSTSLANTLEIRECKSDAKSIGTSESQEESAGITSQELDSTVTSEETKSRSVSRTAHPSVDDRHGQDELVAYEDTVEEEKKRSQPQLSPGTDSRAVSSASKRNYEEHEQDQRDDVNTAHDTLIETKRLRTD